MGIGRLVEGLARGSVSWFVRHWRCVVRGRGAAVGWSGFGKNPNSPRCWSRQGVVGGGVFVEAVQVQQECGGGAAVEGVLRVCGGGGAPGGVQQVCGGGGVPKGAQQMGGGAVPGGAQQVFGGGGAPWGSQQVGSGSEVLEGAQQVCSGGGVPEGAHQMGGLGSLWGPSGSAEVTGLQGGPRRCVVVVWPTRGACGGVGTGWWRLGAPWGPLSPLWILGGLSGSLVGFGLSGPVWHLCHRGRGHGLQCRLEEGWGRGEGRRGCGGWWRHCRWHGWPSG